MGPHASTTLWTALNPSVNTACGFKQVDKLILSKRPLAKLQVGKRAVLSWVKLVLYAAEPYSILPFVTL